ncbi:MAG: hypothetical protein H7836_04000 [Magnetococcus sp. YQC-3]
MASAVAGLFGHLIAMEWMMRERLWIVVWVFGLLFISAEAMAGPVAQATKESLLEVREHLIALVAAQDEKSQAKRLVGIKSATGKVDLQVSKNGELLKGFNAVWTLFKTTRDEKIIPLTMAGKKEEARYLAGGVQRDRMDKMLAILDTLTE